MIRSLFAAATLVMGIVGAPANATTWNYGGEISDCNMVLCELVPLVIGDPVVGQITIDVGADDTFELPPDFSAFSLQIGTDDSFSIDPAFIDFSGSSGTTDENGDFASGMINAAIVGGQLAGLGGAFVIDLVTGDVTLTIGFGTTFVAGITGSFTQQPVPVPGAIWLLGSALIALTRTFHEGAADP